ncbi:MAG: capsular biosynthesis protein [Nevskia sp.]|nr:capsular biosynthesis protein [Nevskia sp.]
MYALQSPTLPLPAVPAEADAAAPAGRRDYLFLQGPIGPFFGLLGRRLRRAGQGVHRINFNGGDRLFWRLPGAVDFRAGAAQWPGFIAARLDAWRITDLVLFGDCRPLHRQAAALARQRGIAVHVFEEGYLRPNWVTLESGGVNGHSALPRDPGWFLAAAAAAPPWDEGAPVGGSFLRRAAADVLYNLATVLATPAYPAYRTHKPWHPLAEYAAGARRFPIRPWVRRRVRGAVRQILAQERPRYLFPLQLDADAQIRHHSPFGRMAPAIEAVITSFARRAPADALLIVTEHPLDAGVVDLLRIARERAAAAGVAQRVICLPAGSPMELLPGSRGMVTVNSTMGIVALQLGLPVTVLGRAVYDLRGLTFQGGLDDFWTQAGPPQRALFDAFRRVVAQRTQINGGFHSAAGLALAVHGAAARLAPSAAAAGRAAART